MKENTYQKKSSYGYDTYGGADEQEDKQRHQDNFGSQNNQQPEKQKDIDFFGMGNDIQQIKTQNQQPIDNWDFSGASSTNT